MHLVQLLASPFIGGPERQVLGLAQALAPAVRTTFVSFAERGLAQPFLTRARADGFEAIALESNFPRVGAAVSELAGILRRTGADLLSCNGYKPDLIGWRAARRAGIPVYAVAHGWTGVTRKVRFYEALDALVMRWLDAVVCVSSAMADKVRRRSVPENRITVIRNAIDPTTYDDPCPGARASVEGFFRTPPTFIMGAAGRLSPEKGFDVLVETAAIVCRERQDTGFVIWGDGPQRAELESRVSNHGLTDRVVLGGFRTDLDRLLPGLDLFVLSSHTEGLPVAVLEAQAAGIPVVATAVGGTPEIVIEGTTGYLAPPADPRALARKLLRCLADPTVRREMGRAAWRLVRDEFTFATQASRYHELFSRLGRVPGGVTSHAHG